jgi:hypothetical protein
VRTSGSISSSSPASGFCIPTRQRSRERWRRTIR